jgi:hypothetical protein
MCNPAAGLGGGEPINHEDVLQESKKAADKILKGFFDLAGSEFDRG